MGITYQMSLNIEFSKVTGDDIRSMYGYNAYEAEIEAAYSFSYRRACNRIKYEKTKFNKSASDGTIRFVDDQNRLIGWYIQECKRNSAPATRINQFLQALMYAGTSLYDVNYDFPGNQFMGCFLTSNDMFIRVPAKNIDIDGFEPLWRKYVNKVSPSNAHLVPELVDWACKNYKPDLISDLDSEFRLDLVLKQSFIDGLMYIYKKWENEN